MTQTAAVLALAFAAGGLFGAVSQKTRFCTMGALADVVLLGDRLRLRMWLMAIGIAILGAWGLQTGGGADLGKSIYRGATLPWLSHLVGGAAFGIGMVLASGCGARTLVRIGAGNLKSLVVFLVVGLGAAMTLRGLLAVGRVAWLDPLTLRFEGGQDLASIVAGLGLAPEVALAVVSLTLGGGLAAYALADAQFRQRDPMLGGVGIGLAVLLAWWASAHFGYLPEDPETLQEAFLTTQSGRPEALSFVAPFAHTLDLLTLWSDTSRKLSFGVAACAGVVAGAAVMALAEGSFRWEGFAGPADTARHLLGALLMGFGGVTALGCTIGQGISGVSTLALGSFLTLGAIVAGAVGALLISERMGGGA